MALDCFTKAVGQAAGDLVEAIFHLAAEHLADSGQLLSEPAEQAAEIALPPVFFLAGLEEPAYTLERRMGGIAQARSEERRVGKEVADTCRSRGAPYP